MFISFVDECLFGLDVGIVINKLMEWDWCIVYIVGYGELLLLLNL